PRMSGPRPELVDRDAPRLAEVLRPRAELARVEDVPGTQPRHDEPRVDLSVVNDLHIPSDVDSDKATQLCSTPVLLSSKISAQAAKHRQVIPRRAGIGSIPPISAKSSASDSSLNSPISAAGPASERPPVLPWLA